MHILNLKEVTNTLYITFTVLHSINCGLLCVHVHTNIHKKYKFLPHCLCIHVYMYNVRTLSDGFNTVASASPLGHIAVWDLDRRRLGATLRDAHNGAVGGMEFLSSQPLMVTSGPDNS